MITQRKLTDIVQDGALVKDAQTTIELISRDIASLNDVLAPRRDDGTVAVLNILQLGDLIVDKAIGDLGVNDDAFASRFRGPEYRAFERLAFVYAAGVLGLTRSEAAHCYEERLRERNDGASDDL